MTAAPALDLSALLRVPPVTPIRDDLLRGADEIAAELRITGRHLRELIETTNIPTFRIGSLHCARRSTLNIWLAAMEFRALMRRPDQMPDDTAPIG